MTVTLGSLLKKKPKYGINAAAAAHTSSLPAYIRITDIATDGRFFPDPLVSVDSPQSRNYILQDGDIVIARTGASVGKSYRYRKSDGELVFAGFLICITPDEKKLDPVFAGYYLQSKPYWDWIAAESVRSGQPGINAQQLMRLDLDLPDIQHQREIGSRLSDVDNLISFLELLISKKQAIKQGMMQELLTGRTRLPGFKQAWSRATLGRISKVTMGQSPVGSSYNTKGNGLPLIQGNADVSKRATIDRVWTSSPTKICEPGNVILTVRAPVGHAAIASHRICLGRGVCGLDAGKDNSFLFHLLVSNESRWSLFSQGSMFTAVGSNEVDSFTIDWPCDPEERSAIAKVLQDADQEIDALQRRLESVSSIKQGMMQELLTGRVRLPVGGQAR